MTKELKELLKYPDMYEEMNLEEQKYWQDYFKNLPNDKLVEILDNLPLNAGNGLFSCVAKIYAESLGTNTYQINLIVESLSYKRAKAYLENKYKSTGKNNSYNPYVLYKTGNTSNKTNQKTKKHGRVKVKKVNFR